MVKNNRLIWTVAVALAITVAIVGGLWLGIGYENGVTRDDCYEFYAKHYCLNNYEDNEGRHGLDIEGKSFTCDAGNERRGTKMHDKYYFKDKEIKMCEAYE